MVGISLPYTTERLLLRTFVEEDLDALEAIESRPDVMRYLYEEPRSRDQVRDALQRKISMIGFDDEHDALRLAIVRTDTSELVGDFSLQRTSRDHAQGEIGFVMHPDHHGQGYATEAGLVLLRVGFEEVGLHRICGRCDARNTASYRLMERLGMRREANLRENEFVKGEWTDELVYAMLASEWAERAAAGS